MFGLAFPLPPLGATALVALNPRVPIASLPVPVSTVVEMSSAHRAALELEPLRHLDEVG